jgi:hypothetical protein
MACPTPPTLPTPMLSPVLLLVREFSLDDPATRWTLIGAGVFVILYVFVIRPSRRRKDPLERSPVPSSLAQQRAVERDMNNLLVELNEMARQMTAQIETRAARLELLIKEADEKIATLKAATGGGGGGGGASAPGPSFSHPVERLISATIGDAAAPAPADPRHARVYAMADEGRTVHEIAREIGRPSGEIQLILDLRGKG